MGFIQNHILEIVCGVIASIVFAILVWLRKLLIRIFKRVFCSLNKDYYLNRIKRSGITNFYFGRNEWIMYREPAQLKDYLHSAKKSVQIATYWLAQGTIEGIQDVYLELVQKEILLNIVLIEPSECMTRVLSQDIHVDAEIIEQNIKTAYRHLQKLRNSLNEDKKHFFKIGVSAALPQAAVIMIDAKTADSKIQLEFRPYRAARINSFSIELKAGKNTKLHGQLEESWGKYFEDATYVNETEEIPL